MFPRTKSEYRGFNASWFSTEWLNGSGIKLQGIHIDSVQSSLHINLTPKAFKDILLPREHVCRFIISMKHHNSYNQWFILDIIMIFTVWLDWRLACYQEILQPSLQLIVVFRYLSESQQQQKLLCNCHYLPQIARCQWFSHTYHCDCYHHYHYYQYVLKALLGALFSTECSNVSCSTACQRRLIMKIAHQCRTTLLLYFLNKNYFNSLWSLII
jgi:hypothetical protein